MNQDISYAIKIAAQRTDLSAHVIRIWERRHEAIKPQRSESKRRLYSETDIQRLILLRLAIEAGYTIGQIAHMPDESLRQIIAAKPTEAKTAIPPEPAIDAQARLFIDRCLMTIRTIDANALEDELQRAALHYSHQQLITEIIDPLMQRIGQLWHEGDLSIASEHLATAVIRAFIDGISTALRVEADAPLLMVATPRGQMHELGALFAGTMATIEGWRVVYLGRDIAADDIATAALLNGATAIALGIAYPSQDGLLHGELKQLRQSLGQDTILIVGGTAAAQYCDVLREIDAVYLEDLPQLRPTLSALKLSTN
ncbi:MAG: MerR family transcriptional regulator [Candidatus Latescibacterota bacterium]|jgi:DNA-binding transcriptional MerR regulator/methylmalonyl-CoA mutase cobalamin-binding subunit